MTNDDLDIGQQFRDSIDATLDNPETTSAIFMAASEEDTEVIGTDKHYEGVGTEELSRDALGDQLRMLDHHVRMVADVTDSSYEHVVTSLVMARHEAGVEDTEMKSVSIHADPEERDH